MFSNRSKYLLGNKGSLIKRFASTTTAIPSFKLIVIGGGTGGLAVSSTLSKVLGQGEVAVIEPSDSHYYQPLWTFVGAGIKTLADSAKPTEQVMPKEAVWVKDHVTKIDPKSQLVTLKDGNRTLKYDYLVIATGVQCKWDKIKGLSETLGKNGVTSNYSKDSVEKTWDFIRDFKGGNAIFTMPSTPIKCPGAAIKIAYLAEDHFTKKHIRNKSNVIYNTAMPKIFSIEKYAKALTRAAEDRGMEVNLSTELTEVRGDKKEAVFKNASKGEEIIYNYELLHVVPPMGPPSFIAESGLGAAGTGYAEVDKHTMQHVKFPNIFSLGDCSSAPTSKTAAAISVQSGVLKKNLLDVMSGKFDPPYAAKYDGYASCPLLVGRDKLILAEFSGYTGKPMETFPVDQGQERASMYWLTKEVIPEIYWSGLVKGKWTGPHRFRNLFSSLSI